MKQEYKNFGYMLAGVVIATMLLNPTFASQISSNLVKGFVAITSSDTKAENNLVGLDAGGKLPTDVIPAEAATTGDGLYFCGTYPYNGDEANIVASCPLGYSELSLKGPINWHQSVVSTPSGNLSTTLHSDWSSANGWMSKTICCVQD